MQMENTRRAGSTDLMTNWEENLNQFGKKLIRRKGKFTRRILSFVIVPKIFYYVLSTDKNNYFWCSS